MLDRHTIFMFVVGLSILNGIFSPLLNIAIPVTAALLPEVFPRTVEWVLLWGSIMLSSLVLLLSGVPAAVYERLVERDPNGTASLWIWLGGALTLSLPMLAR